MAAAPKRRPLLPWPRIAWGLVFALGGLGCSFALWDPLEVDERAHVRRLTAQAARSIEADLEADLRERTRALVRLAQLETWNDQPGETWSLEWTLSCRLFLDHYPSYVDLQWVDTEDRVRWRMDGHPRLADAGSIGGDPPRTRSAAAASGLRPARSVSLGETGASFFPSYRLPDGRAAVQVLVPVIRDRVPLGSLVAVFDAGAALESMLSDHDELGYLVSVWDGSQEIYRTAGAAEPHEEAFAHELPMTFPAPGWRVVVWPDATLLSELRSPLPEVAGLLGGLLGYVLLLTWHFGKTAKRRSQELCEIRDQLELRVGQRTSELRETNERLETQVAERLRAEDSLRHLSGRLLQLQDEERRRIARELHDSTTQMLGALAISLAQAEKLAQRTRSGTLKSHLQDSSQYLERVTADIRTISHLLHPPVLDELGLEYVLPWYVAAFSRRSGIAVDLQVQPDLGRLPQEVELALFRITQEALTNVHRHSGSSTAHVGLKRDAETATLRIEDQGRGVPPGVLDPTGKGIANLGIGIAGMRERVRQLGGRLTIAGAGGTTIEVVLALR